MDQTLFGEKCRWEKLPKMSTFIRKSRVRQCNGMWAKAKAKEG